MQHFRKKGLIMKKYCKKMAVFTIIFVIVCIAFDCISMKEPWRRIIACMTDSEEFISINVGADEIKPYIERAQKKDHTTKLILGDSVCKQMFSGLQNDNDDICMLGSNAAISMTGQYILAKQYIENHKEVTDVYLIVLPGSLEVTFDTQWGYQYTVMPFVETDTLKLLETDTIKKMEAVYGAFFMKPLVVEGIDKSAINRKIYLNLLNTYSSSYQQSSKYEIAEQYIKKIYELCKEREIELHLLACPVVESRRDEIEASKADYMNTWLYTVFPEFLEEVVYYSNEETEDGVHFAGEFAVQENYNEKLRIILVDSSLLQELQFKQSE